MGFDPVLAKRALDRCNGDWDSSLTMLTAGLVPEEDEFDLLNITSTSQANTKTTSLVDNFDE